MPDTPISTTPKKKEEKRQKTQTQNLNFASVTEILFCTVHNDKRKKTRRTHTQSIRVGKRVQTALTIRHIARIQIEAINIV